MVPVHLVLGVRFTTVGKRQEVSLGPMSSRAAKIDEDSILTIMPQRRAINTMTTRPAENGFNNLGKDSRVASIERLASDENIDEELAPLSVEAEYQTERHRLRVKKWKESPFAVGLTEPTWLAERSRPPEQSRDYGDPEVSDPFALQFFLKFSPHPHWKILLWIKLEKDHTGFLCCSAQICPLLGAKRVSNMAVLSSSQEWVEEVNEDDETGDFSSRRYSRPKLNVVVGPFWPVLVCVTYPLILGISGWTLWSGILAGGKSWAVVFIWASCTIALITSLTLTACRDPGILYKYHNPPPQDENTWRWCDKSQSYRPQRSFYDPDTAVVVEGFDHTYVINHSYNFYRTERCSIQLTRLLV